MDRRAVLGGLAGLGTLAALGGCDSHAGHPARKPTGGLTATPSASSLRGPPSEADWLQLQRRLAGSLRRPGEIGYDAVRELFNRRFDGIRPAAVVSVASVQDVVTALAFVRAHGLPLSVRAGGHSYLGGSAGPGLVIDVRPMHQIDVDPVTQHATIGAGAALIDVYDALGSAGVSVPAGSCPTVGITGLALGGGMGVVARQYGLTCDRLISAQLVLADGRQVSASATNNADLYWAIRGGGGSFGVVTSLTLATHPTQSLATFYYAWDWAAAAQVLDAWQQTVPVGPDALWSTCHLLTSTDKAAAPSVSVAGVFVGSASMLQTVLQPFLNRVGVAPTSVSLRDQPYRNVMFLEAGCADATLSACHLAGQSPGGALVRDAFVAASDFFTGLIPAAGLAALVGAIEARQADPALGTGGVGFDTWGGAVGRVAPEATAFVHRSARFGAQYTASWQDQPGNAAQQGNQQSLMAIRATIAAYANGEAYQNYADPTLSDPLTAYYGGNLDRLKAVKRTYDPDNLFRPPQGIPVR